MKSTLVRRLSAAVIAPVLTFGTLAATTQSAQAAPNPEGTLAANWLVNQIPVTVGAPYFEGTALDIFFALNDLGTKEAEAGSILSDLESHSETYIGTLPAVTAGATGKLATAVQNAGGDTADFDGNDLIANLESTVVTTGDETGRAKDLGGYEGADYSSTFGQVWVVQALAQANSSLADEATAYLLKQQCADGSFRGNLFHINNPADEYDPPSADRECGDPTIADDDQISVDATGLSLRALQVAKAEGLTGLDDEISAGIAWLKDQQEENGSFEDNANRTGLAAIALERADESVAAGKAAAWLKAHQVTTAVAAGNQLVNEVGGIALDDQAIEDGKTDGIPAPLEYGNVRGQWISATAQSAAALSALRPASELTVTHPAGYTKGGAKITVKVAGLYLGESAKLGSSTQTAGASGSVSLTYTTPKTTGTKTLTVSASGHTGTKSVSIKVLGAKKLKLKVKHSSLRKKKKQTVKLSGLAAKEPVRVFYRGKKIKSGVATSKGTYSYTFKVGSSKGKKTVKIFGAYSGRSGSKTFKVK